MKHCLPVGLLLLIFSMPLHFAHAQNTSEPIPLDEITVTPGRFTIYDGTQSPLSLSKREIERFPLIDNDVARAAQIFPGVVSNDFSARFNVRGGEKDEILVRLDGMELFEPYHLQDFGGAISIIDLGLVRRADLLMGGFPAEYGDKMSGVFDITAKEGSRDRFGANFGIDLINAHTLLGGPLTQNGSWVVSARRGYVDLILALMDADEELKPQYADLYSKIVYDLTARDKLTFNGIYAWDKNRIDETDDENDLRSSYQNTMVWAKWRHLFSDQIWSELYLFNGIATRDRRKGADGVDTRDFGFIGVKEEVTARMFKAHTIRGGVQWRWATADYNYDIHEQRAGVEQYERITAKVDDNGNEFKVYLQDEWQIHPMVAINVGGRYLFQDFRRSGVQKAEISPRVALAVKPLENLIIRGAWGRYHQPTELLTIPVEDGRDSVGRAEEATHYVIGGEYTAGGNLLIRAEGYYKTLENLSGQIRDFGRQTQIFTNPDSGDVKGFELLVSRAVSERFRWSTGYAYTVAKERSGEAEFFREFDQRHTIAVNGSYQISSGWHLHTTWRFHTGNPTTHLTHSPVRLPDGSLTCNRQFGPTNAERLPAYHSLDLRFTKTSPHQNWQLSWYVQILNLYNRANIHERAFSKVRNEDTHAVEACEVSDEPLFPIVPTLGVSVTF